MEWKFKLPKELSELEAQVKKGMNEIKTIQAEVDRLGNDGGAQLNYNPPTINNAFGRPDPNIDTERIVKNLERDIFTKKSDLITYAKESIRDLDSKTAKQVLSDVDRAIFPNAYENLDIEDLDYQAKEERTLEQSQEFTQNSINKFVDESKENIDEADILDHYTDKFLTKLDDFRKDKDVDQLPNQNVISGDQYKVDKFNIDYKFNSKEDPTDPAEDL